MNDILTQILLDSLKIGSSHLLGSRADLRAIYGSVREECGMEPLDALIAATSNAAKLIGEEERRAIDKGKIADLVLLDANPVAELLADWD